MRRDSTKTWQTWIVRGGAALFLALTCGYIPYHLYARSGFAKYLELRQLLGTLRTQNERLRADNARLAREAAALQSDPRAIERVAREELGWVRPGELMVDLSGAGEPRR
jgi:cell division protein FtsB